MSKKVVEITPFQSLNDYCTLQKIIFELIEADIDNVVDYILKSPFSMSPTKIQFLAQTLLIAANCHPFIIKFLVRLFRSIIEEIRPENNLRFLPEMVLSKFFNDLKKQRIIDEECGKFRFIRNCYTDGLFNINDILSMLKEFFVKYQNKFVEANCLLFCYFTGDIYNNEKGLFDEMFCYYKKHAPSKLFSNYIIFVNNFI